MRAVLFLSILFLSSCFTTGSNFPSRTEWIRKNATKKEDAKLVLGQPFAIGSSGGVNTWTYAFYKYQVFGKTFHKELKFYWNKDGSVKYYSFNSSFPEDFTMVTEMAGSSEEEIFLNSNTQNSSLNRQKK